MRDTAMKEPSSGVLVLAVVQGNVRTEVDSRRRAEHKLSAPFSVVLESQM